MSQLTETGRQAIENLAQRYGLSVEAVDHMARAVARGGGTMAQFNIPELGGNGQWMAGGMTMVGDMFNHGLKATVDNLCGELAAAMSGAQFYTQPPTMAGAAWWPQDLGQPASVGGQNSTRYAYFPQARRVAFDPGTGGEILLLDSGEHQIGGWSQQQSGPGDMFAGITFSSQFGQFPLASLPRVGGGRTSAEPVAPDAPPASQDPPPSHVEAQITPEISATVTSAPAPDAPAPAHAPASAGSEDILGIIERLARLRDAGALTDEEFAAKKAELLARL